MNKPRNPKDYNKFQLFVLTYLYAREYEEGTLTSSDMKDRVTLRIEDFIHATPKEILPNNRDEMYHELIELLQDLLISDVGEKFFLTHTNGTLYVKKDLASLVSKFFDKQQKDSFLDGYDLDTGVKSYFEGLWDKLKEKSQEQIVDEVISGAKQYGPVAFLFLLKVLQGSN